MNKILEISKLFFACCALCAVILCGCRKEVENGTAADTSAESGQLLNGGFEDWHGTGKEAEPVHWHSFMSADGEGLAYNAARAQQVQPSSEVRPGSEGKTSVCIYARSILGIIANGNLTTGRIHVGSANADDASNYNFTQLSNENFCQILTAKPDSIRFWAKFECPDAEQKARMSAIIHDAYDYRDPEAPGDLVHAVGKACHEFTKGDGAWHCYTLPFDYAYAAAEPHFLLISFTTNAVHGKGSKKDKLYIDDVELVYAR